MKRISILMLAGIMILATGINQLNAQNMENKKVPALKLNNGLEMPQLGLGTYLASNEDCKQATFAPAHRTEKKNPRY